MKKRYWLRGLIAGVAIYALALLIVDLTAGSELHGIAVMTGAVIIAPVILIALIIGAIYGKIKSKKA